MRLVLSVLAAVTFALPGQALARKGRPGWSGARVAQAPPPPIGPSRAPAAGAPAVAPSPPPGAAPAYRTVPAPGYAYHPTAPAPPPGAPPRVPGSYYGPGYYPGYRYYVSPWAYSAWLAAPWWWGWGWGYGYYPVYPAPPAPPPGELAPLHRINAEIAFTGGPTDQRALDDPSRRVGPGSSAGVSLRIEGRELGFHAGYDGFFTGRRVDFATSTSLDRFTAHLTWPFLSGESGRLRLEGGVSVLSWPAMPGFAATTAVGPDVGVSGHLALVGPFGLVGHARVTPWPRTATDFHAAAALRFGPVAVTGGWRDLRAEGGSTAPDMRFAGPQFGLSLLF